MTEINWDARFARAVGRVKLLGLIPLWHRGFTKDDLNLSDDWRTCPVVCALRRVGFTLAEVYHNVEVAPQLWDLHRHLVIAMILQDPVQAAKLWRAVGALAALLKWHQDFTQQERAKLASPPAP